MQFFVEMKLSDASRGQFDTTWSEAITFITQMAIPTVQMLADLKAKGKLIGGGPRVGDIWLVLIIEAESALELDKMLEVLPLWPRMQTTIAPLTTLPDRILSLRHKLAWIKDNLDAAFPKDLV